jgi:hypothetical protein
MISMTSDLYRAAFRQPFLHSPRLKPEKYDLNQASSMLCETLFVSEQPGRANYIGLDVKRYLPHERLRRPA